MCLLYHNLWLQHLIRHSDQKSHISSLLLPKPQEPAAKNPGRRVCFLFPKPFRFAGQWGRRGHFFSKIFSLCHGTKRTRSSGQAQGFFLSFLSSKRKESCPSRPGWPFRCWRFTASGGHPVNRKSQGRIKVPSTLLTEMQAAVRLVHCWALVDQ